MKDANKQYMENHVFPRLDRLVNALEIIATGMVQKDLPQTETKLVVESKFEKSIPSPEVKSETVEKPKRSRKKKTEKTEPEVKNEPALRESGVTG